MPRRLTRFKSLSEGRIRSGVYRFGESRQQDRLLGSLSHAALLIQYGHGGCSFFMPGLSACPPSGTNHSTFIEGGDAAQNARKSTCPQKRKQVNIRLRSVDFVSNLSGSGGPQRYNALFNRTFQLYCLATIKNYGKLFG